MSSSSPVQGGGGSFQINLLEDEEEVFQDTSSWPHGGHSR